MTFRRSYQDISKSNTARSFKLRQMIDYLVKIKKKFATLDIENVIFQNLFQLEASNLDS